MTTTTPCRWQDISVERTSFGYEIVHCGACNYQSEPVAFLVTKSVRDAHLSKAERERFYAIHWFLREGATK